MTYRVYIDKTENNKGFDEQIYETTDIFYLMEYLDDILVPGERVWKIEEIKEM